MQQSTNRARTGLCVLAALPLVFAMASASAAGPSDMSPAVRQALQRDLGMSNAQLAQYLKVERLAAVEVTTAALRKMWDAMRARPIDLAKHDTFTAAKGSKLFMTVANDRQIAVAGNTVLAPGFGLCEVTVVSPFDGSYRYTLKRIPE